MKAFFRRSALIAGGIVASVALFGWLAGMRSVGSFGDVYITLGGFIWVLGILLLTASWRNPLRRSYHIARSVSVQNLSERTRAEARDIFRDYAALLNCATVGTLVGGVGALLRFVFA